MKQQEFLPLLLLSTLSFAAACGGGGDGGADDAGLPDAVVAPADADVADATPPDPDAAIPVMSIFEIIPPAASRLLDTDLTVNGFNIDPGASLVLDNCDSGTSYDLSTDATIAADGESITSNLVADPTREQGLYTVTVTNPDGESDQLLCAFRILAQLPPTVTDITPASAFNGITGDGTNSDTVVTITGTGFEATPSLRWIKTDGSVAYDALFVGFVSDTQLTAIVPSETLAMQAGDYNVLAVNPNLLSAFWDLGTPAAPNLGVFEITTVPPPSILDVTPARIVGADCPGTVLTVTGANFDTGATLWWQTDVPADCNSATTALDASGNTLCSITVDDVPDANTITAHFESTECPADGPWPVIVLNPDGQTDTFFNIEIRPNSQGHLEPGDFDIQTSELATPRFKHTTDFGFDTFGNSYMYVVGGQDANGGVLDSTEIAQLDIFGTIGAFRFSEQYDANSPTRRSANILNTPRQGAAMSRLGRTFVVTGGSETASDIQATVNALNTVETASILSFGEMPAIQLPQQLGGQGLPSGSWYYQVSAVDGSAWGEGLATREVVALNSNGEIQVCWAPPDSDAGSTTYNIYRSLASDGRANSAAAIAFEFNGTCFVDNGAEELAPAPGNLRGTPSTGTALAAGTFSYRVAADVALTAGGSHETYAGYVSAIEITDTDIANGDAALTLNWDAVEGATGYRVFKLDTATGDFLMLEGGEVAATTFTDDGAAFDGSNRGPRDEIRALAPGSLGKWNANTVPNMNTAREGHESVAIVMDPTAAAGLLGRILIAGGRIDNQENATLNSAESIGILGDGSLESAWIDEAPVFNSPRAFFSLLTTQGSDSTPFPEDPEEPPCTDLDGDGFLPCSCAPAGTPINQLDCNDADASINPAATEICGDGIDQDCDMGCTGGDEVCSCDVDIDQDGHLSNTCGGDDCCDDGTEGSLGCSAPIAGTIHPGAADQCGDGIDQNCDGVDEECTCATDADGDGFVSIECGGTDCCDVGTDTALGCNDTTAPGINPGAEDICSNGVDEDCSGGEPICRVVSEEPYRPEAQVLSSSVGVQTTRSVASSRDWRPSAFAADRVISPSGALNDGLISHQVVGGEPVYVVAVFGDDLWAFNNGASLNTMEVCLVDDLTGLLACDTNWVSQSAATSPQDSFAMDALLYFQTLYPFFGLNSEVTGVNSATRALQNAATQRYDVQDTTVVVGDQLVGGNQSSNAGPALSRAYYKAVRLLAHVYIVGGWVDDSDGLGTPGPTATIERQQQ